MTEDEANTNRKGGTMKDKSLEHLADDLKMLFPVEDIKRLPHLKKKCDPLNFRELEDNYQGDNKGVTWTGD